MTSTCKRESKAASSERSDSGDLRGRPRVRYRRSEHASSRNDIRLFAEHWVNDEIGGVGFDGICSRWGTNYMREIHSLNVWSAK